MSGHLQKIILFVLVVSGWFALIAQFYLIIINRVASIPETIIRYFSFFTILTNLIVAICCVFILFKPSSSIGKFFSRPAVLTAIAVYIAVVGIVYNIILRFLWNPKGLQLIVDELLHSLIPVLFIVLWFANTSKTILKWKNIFPWLIYPLVYIMYILARGSLSDFYPYPFINVSELGYGKVLFNCAGLLLVFLFLSLLFVAIGKIRNKGNYSGK
jgi:hypothetical protein